LEPIDFNSSNIFLQSLNFFFVEDTTSVNNCFGRLGVATSVTEEEKNQAESNGVNVVP